MTDNQPEQDGRPTKNGRPASRQYPKETETQATNSPVPEEFQSNIAPQGYEAELVEEIADMETPEEKRRKAIRYLIWTVLFVIVATLFCIPRNAERPPDIPIPYDLESRPLPSSELFLYQIAPREVGDFRRVHQQVARSYEDPFVGAEIATATYTNSQGRAVTVSIIDAGSYINANRYMGGLKRKLAAEGQAANIVDRIWLETSFLEWEIPSPVNKGYGFAWSNERFYYAVVAPQKEDRDYMVENFPY
jgi:hypothetical protein